MIGLAHPACNIFQHSAVIGISQVGETLTPNPSWSVFFYIHGIYPTWVKLANLWAIQPSNVHNSHEAMHQDVTADTVYASEPKFATWGSLCRAERNLVLYNMFDRM